MKPPCSVRLLGIAVLTLTLLQSQRSLSQSALSLYEPGKRVTVTGMLVGSAAPSPPQSVYLLVTATDAKGNEVHWAVEGDPMDELKKRGWKDDALKMGEVITVTGHPVRAGQRPQDRMPTPGRGAMLRAFTLANEGRLILGTEIALADGRTISFGRMK
jgi:Family of unknown function (DUF6152)